MSLQRAAYRFLSNSTIGVLDILEPHQVRIAERCRSRLVVLAVQDTTILNYSGLETAEGFVDIGGYVSGSKGIAAHAENSQAPGRIPDPVIHD